MTAAAGGHRILLIDDDDDFVELATILLKEQGHQLSAARSGLEGLAALRADPTAVDWIVTDMNLIGATGLEIARELLAIRPGVPIVLCSGDVSEAMRAEARLIGIRAVLVKPIQVELMCEELVQLIAASQVGNRDD